MIGWGREPFELLNEGGFAIVEPGPLHAPIYGFSIRRNEKQQLLLETRAPVDAKSSAPDYPSGTLRINTDSVELLNAGGIKATLKGVQPYDVFKENNYAKHHHELTETSLIHKIEIVLRPDEKASYAIEWLDNFPRGPFHWPDVIKTSSSTDTTRTIGLGEDGITLTTSDGTQGSSRAAAKLFVGEIEVYACALDAKEAGDRPRPGCILYVGQPDGLFRCKVRNALSFALGTYLVELGGASYNDRWELQCCQFNQAYSIGRKVFDLPILHPAPLNDRYWQHGVDRGHLNRLVNAIFETYEELDFGNLSWAYWHAQCATPHIAGAHFGAAIEALQRRYIAAHPAQISTSIISDRGVWTRLSDDVCRAIAALEIPDDRKEALRQNIGSLNNANQRSKLESILQAINTPLSSEELKAWKRRNDAAHGNEMPVGGEISLIQDTKLLKMISHRMILRITNGSEFYFDYASPGFVMRHLKDPASSRPGA